MSMFLAAPLTREYIERVTWGLRQALALTDPYLPVAELLEFGLPRIAPGFDYDIVEAAAMGQRHGAVNPVTRVLMVREDVYDGLVAGVGRDRFTVCHEIGHAVLHPQTLNRVRPGQTARPFENPEWQADNFSGSLLMPRHMMLIMGSISEIVGEFGVSEDAAKVRARILGLHLPK